MIMFDHSIPPDVCRWTSYLEVLKLQSVLIQKISDKNHLNTDKPVSHIVVLCTPTPIEVRIAIHFSKVLFIDGKNPSDEITVGEPVSQK